MECEDEFCVNWHCDRWEYSVLINSECAYNLKHRLHFSFILGFKAGCLFSLAGVCRHTLANNYSNFFSIHPNSKNRFSYLGNSYFKNCQSQSHLQTFNLSPVLLVSYTHEVVFWCINIMAEASLHKSFLKCCWA